MNIEQPIPKLKPGSRKLKLLRELKARLIANVPEAGVKKVILFGSQATGKARKDSDYDFLIVLKNAYDWQLKDKIMDECFDVAIDRELNMDIKVISEHELTHTIRGKMPFVLDALAQGVAV